MKKDDNKTPPVDDWHTDDDLIICPECDGMLKIIFTGFEMYGDEPIARNYHCDECGTDFSEGYGDLPTE